MTMVNVTSTGTSRPLSGIGDLQHLVQYTRPETLPPRFIKKKDNSRGTWPSVTGATRSRGNMQMSIEYGSISNASLLFSNAKVQLSSFFICFQVVKRYTLYSRLPMVVLKMLSIFKNISLN